jgi:hypothetical protein
MTDSNARDTFHRLVSEATSAIGARPLNADLQELLNRDLGANSRWFADMFAACQAAIASGWMCEREAGGIRYGRVYKPAAEFNGFSVDVVDMLDVQGPHHRHPNGEIDLIMPLTQTPGAKFDGHGAGWLVYDSGSAHFPTVTNGRALVLYLLPQGAIEFTR